MRTRNCNNPEFRHRRNAKFDLVPAIVVLAAVVPYLGQPNTAAAAPKTGTEESGTNLGGGSCPATDEGELSNGSTIVGSTIGSSDDFVTGCGGIGGGQDEVFQFTVSASGTWTLDTCTVPACWDTTLEIREETGGGCPGDFVACDDDGCNVCYYESSVSAFLQTGTTYYLIVDGWSTFAYGVFTVTASQTCTSDSDCDDGVFCNGAETCDLGSNLCQAGGGNPCTTFEGFPAPCDEGLGACTELDPCTTWIAGGGSGFFFPQANNCPDTATWVFDDVQSSHHTTGLLDHYTTPISARVTPTDASSQGTVFSVDQALFTVEDDGSCNPLAQIAGSQCTGSATVDPGGSPAHDLPCGGTMPALPNNDGDFNRCEIDFFLAYRTAENGAGMSIAGEKPLLGGPAAADDFKTSVIWIEDCPPTGAFAPVFFGDDENMPADFAEAVVCQKPEAQCCHPDGSCSLGTANDCGKDGGTVVCTGTAEDGPCSCEEGFGCPALDIKPGSCPNSFNRKSHGVLPVALLGTDSFDVNDVDLSTLIISRADGVGGSVGPNEGPPGPHSGFADVGTPFDGDLCDCHEDTADGKTDLSMKFKTDEVVDALEMNGLAAGALVELIVSGDLLNGTPFEASDCVRLVPPGTPPGQVRVSTGEEDRWIEIGPLDLALDGGGFGTFKRTYPLSSIVTLAAPLETVNGAKFLRWIIDRQQKPKGANVIYLSVTNARHEAKAIYGLPALGGLPPRNPPTTGGGL